MYLTIYNDKIYFTGVDSDGGYELWRTNANAGGFELLLNPLPNQSYSPLNSTYELRVFNNSLWFRAVYNNDLGNELWHFTDNTPGGFSISGTVVYNNLSLSPMANCAVNLTDTLGTLLHSTTTDAGGAFSFSGQPSGTYQLAVSTSEAWHIGASNSVDALLILKHFVGMSQLQGLFLAAADVNDDAAVNSVDALLVAKRFTGLETSFPAGDWILESSQFNLQSDLNGVTLKGLNYGDVNGSYAP
jgi:ELWxxDGT repeat protein